MLQQRLNKLRKILKEKDFDGFLVSNFYNIFYLSGFKTLTENEREGWLLVTTKNSYLFSDSRYLSFPRRRESRKLDPPIKSEDDLFVAKLITPEKGLIKHLQEIIIEEKIKNLGVEGEDLKVSEFNQFKKYFPNVNLISLEKLIIKLREIKDEEEIKRIRFACQITNKCLKDVIKTIKIGSSEKEIAFKIEFWLKEKNYDLAFCPIVAIDKNSSLPHYDTRDGNNGKVKKGSIILIDFGAKYQNYLSDITRMIFVGKPTDEMVKKYNILLNAQEKTIAALPHRSGEADGKTRLQNIDNFCRKQLITNHQSLTTNSYPHSTGHGVGLQIHEYPKISPISNDEIKAGQVFTIEPGIYISNRWGMRIEDTVLINKGGTEILTKFRKQITVI